MTRSTIRSKTLHGGSVIPLRHASKSGSEQCRAVRVASSLPRIFTRSSSRRVLVLVFCSTAYHAPSQIGLQAPKSGFPFQIPMTAYETRLVRRETVAEETMAFY